MNLLALLTIASGSLSLLCLLALHFTSPEYQPSWRMISEYALGKHKWLLTVFFLLWGLCTMLVAVMLWSKVTSTWAMVGIILIFVTGVGATFGGLFDIKHKLHGLAFGLGVPFLPIASLLVTYHLINNGWGTNQTLLLVAAHLVWTSLVLMAVSMMLLFSGFKKTGLPMGPGVEPPKELPAGVIGINGYMNRLLVVCYIGWCLMIAVVFLSLN